MKRLVLAVALLISFSFVSTAQAGPLKYRDAAQAAVDHAFSHSKGMPNSVDSVDCRRTGAMSFRCVISFKTETRWVLNACRFKVDVEEDGKIETRTVSRRCAPSDVPFLSNGQGWRVVRRLVDDSYHSDENTSWGAGYGRVSMTRMSFELDWGNDDRICIQAIKVALIDGTPKGDAGEAVCTEGAEWPRSRSVLSEKTVWSDSWQKHR